MKVVLLEDVRKVGKKGDERPSYSLFVEIERD